MLDAQNSSTDGRGVDVTANAETAKPAPTEVSIKNFWKGLLELAGKAEGLPPDAAMNHDHYLYGTPKK